MIYVNVILTVKNPADIAKVAELLAEAARSSRQEPGCQRFEAYHSTTNEARFLLNEHWESQAALDTHRTAFAYTQIYQPKILPLVDREPHPSKLLA